MILFFVGNASHALSSSNSLAILEVSVILSNYRGYGSSDGRLTESAIVANAKITLQKLLEHYSDRPVVLIGKNLGIADCEEYFQYRHFEVSHIIVQA